MIILTIYLFTYFILIVFLLVNLYLIITVTFGWSMEVLFFFGQTGQW